MRKVMADLVEGKAFMEKIEGLSTEARDHLRFVILKIVDCYIDEESHACILIDHDQFEKTELISINAGEMHVAEMLGVAYRATMSINMEDAPPKGMMN